MADVTSTNDRAPITIVIEEKDATITIVPTGKVQERLRDIAVAGIDMQLVTDWIAAGYSNSSLPVHHLVASDVGDLWHIRTDTDIVDLLQSETERRKIVRKTYPNTRFSSLLSEASPLSKATYDRLMRLDEHPLNYILMEPSHMQASGESLRFIEDRNLPLTMRPYGDNWNRMPTLPERDHWHESLPERLFSRRLVEEHARVVDKIGDAIFSKRTLQEVIDEIVGNSQTLSDTMTELADSIVEDGEALGDAMMQRAKELAADAFTVKSRKLSIGDDLDVPQVGVEVFIGGGEPPRIFGEETEVELPSVDK